MKAQEDKLLNDLFDSARNAAPEYTFKETKRVFLSAATIGAAILGLKTISSSILKTKFFIMTISTVTIISSAVVLYTTAVTEPATSASDYSINEGNSKNLIMAMPAPNLFTEVAPQALVVVEPDDTTKKIEEEINAEEIEIMELSKSINLDSLISTLTNINIQEIGTGNQKKLIILSGTDTIMMQNMAELTNEIESALELVKVELAGQMDELEEILEHDLEEMQEHTEELQKNAEESHKMAIGMHDQVYYTNHSSQPARFPEAEWHKRSFVINESTNTDDLAAMRDEAVAAGIDFTYTANVKKNIIKKLDLNMKLEDDKGSTKQSQFHITKSRGEVFSVTLVWYENEEGEAVSFSKSKDKKKSCKCN